MATKTFYNGEQVRYEPESITLNGQKGAIWTRWIWQDGCWQRSGNQFCKERSTRNDVILSFDNDL